MKLDTESLRALLAVLEHGGMTNAADELDDPPGEMGYVSDLVVSSALRGQGVGRALLRRAEGCVREAGVTTLRLSVLAGNRGAIALYEDEGFAPVEVDMEKRLDS